MKKYSTPNLVKAVSLGAVIATLLSSVSPILAANLAITGGKVLSTSEAGVLYQHGSYGSIVFAGDNDYCGADNVIDRGSKQQDGVVSRITAKEQYEKFITNKEFGSRNPYGTITEKVTWFNNSITTPSDGYMGALTGGFQNAMPEGYGIYSFATGCGSAATGNYSTVFGVGATAKAGITQALRVSTRSSRAAGIKMGEGSVASGTSAIAIGENATASGKKSISIGESSKATMDDAIAIGSYTEGSGINSVAIGNIASASGYNSVAIGLKTKASAEYAVVIGSKAEAEALGSIAIGGGEPADNGGERKVIAKGKNSIAIGSHTYAETAHSVAVGINAQVRVIDGVAVGGGSVSRIDKNTLGYDPATNTTTTNSDLAWKSTGGDFSVGNTNQKLTRQITNVAAGTKDTDAVNVAQLKALREVIAGGGAGGSWNLSVNDNNSTAVNAGNTVDFSVKNGDNGVGQDNLKITKENGSNIKFALSDELNLMSVTTGESIMDASGFRFIGDDGPSITVNGIHAGDKTIKGVVAGEEDTDAVNFGQLKDFTTKIKTGWKLAVENGKATDIGAESTVNFQAANNENRKNINIEKDENNNVTFDLADNIQVMSVTTGDSIMDAVGFRFTDDGPSITVNGIHAGDKTIKGVAEGTDDTDAVNYAQLKEIENKIAGGGLVKWDEGGKLITIGAEKDGIIIDVANKLDGARAITGVAKGNISNVSTDVINGEQIHSIGNEIAKIFGGKVSFDVGVFTGPKYNLTTIDEDGVVSQQEYNDVGSALDVVNKNVFAVDHTMIIGFNDISEYFGGGAKYEKGKWKAPTFKISQRENVNGAIVEKEYHNVADALGDIDNSIKDIYTQINNVTGSSLVKWDEYQKLIIIGKEKGGTKINITGSEGARTIAGVKAAEQDNEAVNKKQLDDSIKQTSAAAVLYDKNDDNSVNYESITLGSEKVNGQVALLNVKDGKISENSHDAVNGSQINTISGDVAKFFGGGTKFNNGSFTGPRYNLSTVSADGTVKQKTAENVGDALKEVDANVKNVNSRVTYVTNEFNQKFNNFSKDSLLWSEQEKAFVALHGSNGEKANSKIKFLADGDISSDSAEAVNGSQLFKIAKNISNYFGGSTDVVAGIEPTFLIKDQTYHNVTDAFTGVNISIANLDGKISEMKKDNLVQQEGGASGIITIGKATAGTKISVAGVGNAQRTISGVKEAEKGDEAVNKAQLDKSIEKISKNIEIASAAAVLYDKNEDGVVDYNRVTLGSKNSTGPVALLNVKDGRIADGSTDAITGNQLYRMSNQLAAYFGGGAGYNNGEWTAPNFKVAQLNADGTTVEKSYNNVADALGGVNSNMVSINDRIDHVINKVDSDALKWNDLQKGYDAKHDGKSSKIINVADGKILAGSKDAINGGQLWKTNERIAGVEKNIQHITNRVDNISNTVTDLGKNVDNIENRVDNIENTVNNLSDGAVNYDKTADGKKTNKITLKGGDASEPVLIDNLADGRIEKGSKEAINGGQLHEYTEQKMKIVLDESKHYIDQRVNNIVVDAIDDAVDQAKQYTDMKFNILSYDIKSVRKEARQAAAVGLAVSNLRYFDDPGSLSVSFGSGAWRGQSAFAFGAGYTSENGKIRSNLSATSAGGHWGVGGAITLKIK